MYPWLVWLHVIGGFGFILAHGASAAVAYRLRKERDLERVRALLDLSSSTVAVLYASLLVMLIAGIVAGFLAKWWGMGWIWVSLVLTLAIIVWMYLTVSRSYGNLRKAVGLPYMAGGRPQPAVEPASAEEINAMLERGQPALQTVVGFGGLVIILWLMMFKPF